MSETMLSRVARLLSGTVEDAISHLEQVGGVTVMREAIREVDRAVDDLRSDVEALGARRLQASRQQRLLAQRSGELEEKARFAMNEGRADLAEAAIARQIDFEQEAAKLDAVQVETREEETRLERSLAALKARKQQMEDALNAYLSARAQAALGPDAALCKSRSAEAKAEQSERAFDRAMAGAGGVGFTRADATTINRVAEIDGMQRSAAIAERLAKLKSSMQPA
jgi:phage shock protein A